MSRYEGWRFFGCRNTEAGHYLLRVTLGTDYDRALGHFDGVLAPRDPTPYVAAFSRLGGIGYSALSWWDFTVDKRPGSNAIVFCPSLLCSPEYILASAPVVFPTIMARMPPIKLDAAALAEQERHTILRAALANTPTDRVAPLSASPQTPASPLGCAHSSSTNPQE
jgi:hypothetical protein